MTDYRDPLIDERSALMTGIECLIRVPGRVRLEIYEELSERPALKAAEVWRPSYPKNTASQPAVCVLPWRSAGKWLQVPTDSPPKP